ncbi:hypothetical protein MCOR25_003082 [Pyricularia grisea]|uniref:Uncharacterized protein n=1 Tax=Pyricularia grisea TaxID=148305 RepID=A0A6P8B9K3_PYRGI|nr:uncharacterized protein PgNI_04375 [Pyricularia grisea]KAI6374820.1 hypothetical protein MCOR25_003082 [Pyricularia grisea]TLD12347.1 hypothetical protein PgNI_04375 [Pyricularia grisea]
MRSLVSATNLLTILGAVNLVSGYVVIPPSLSIPEDNRAFGFTRSAFPQPASKLQKRYARQQQHNTNNYASNNNNLQPGAPAKPTTVIDYENQEDLSLVTMGFVRGGHRSADPVLTTTVVSVSTNIDMDQGHGGQEHQLNLRQRQVTKTGSGSGCSILKTAAIAFANQTSCDTCDCCCCSTVEGWGSKLPRLLKLQLASI